MSGRWLGPLAAGFPSWAEVDPVAVNVHLTGDIAALSQVPAQRAWHGLSVPSLSVRS
jgi:hypothetical protein